MTRSRGPSPSPGGEGDAAPVTGVNDRDHRSEPKRPRPSPPRYKKADVDRKVLDLIIDHEPITYRQLSVATGYGMWVLTESVKRLRAAGLIIPGVRGRHGFLVAVKEVK